MLSLRISFDDCDLVKHAGQVFFPVRDEEVNSSRGTHPAQLSQVRGAVPMGEEDYGLDAAHLPGASVWGREGFRLCPLKICATSARAESAGVKTSLSAGLFGECARWQVREAGQGPRACSLPI